VTSTLLLSILAQDGGNQGGGLLSLLIILIPMGAILWMTIVPQRKARQRHADMLRSIGVGDEVMTNGGMIGVITHADDDVYHVEVDTDIVVRVAKSAIARNMAEPDPAARPAPKQRRGLLGGATAAGDDTTTESR
jgi:preprotein translocase subunit YajC